MKRVITLVLFLAAITTGAAFADKKPAASGSGAASASGSGSASGSSAALSDADKADVAKWMAFFDKIVDTAEADQKDCPKMAHDLNALIDANQDLLKKAADAAKSGHQMPKEAREHFMKAAGRLMTAMQNCQHDRDVNAAFARLNVGPKRR